MIKNISIVGGDLRQLTLYKLLLDDGFNVKLFGFNKLNEGDDLDLDFIKKSEAIILPMPISTDNVHINSVYSESLISLDMLIPLISSAALVFGGQFKDQLKRTLTDKKIQFFDYLNREELAIKNAVPTVEGAISIAISETPYTIHQSSCLVLGYGRIGKVLSRLLLDMGADVTVCARKLSDLALAQNYGLKAIPLSKLKNNLSDKNIIFNTIPKPVLDSEALGFINPDSLIIDLASKPGGVDFECAKEKNLKVIWALSLPGKIAPVTSGKIIKDTILNILNELEV